MNRKLLIIGSNTIHVYNYIQLIQEYFDDILLLTNQKNDNYKFTTIEIDFRLGINIFSSVVKLKKIVKEFKPSVIHIHQANSYAFISTLAFLSNKTPKVLTAWGSDILINPKKNFVLNKMLKFSLNNVDIITSDSLYMSSKMKEYNLKLDIRIVNFGIELEEKRFKKEKIIYSNRLHNSLYNIEKIIFSFHKFSKENDDWKLVIGAIGTDTDKLKKIVDDLNLKDKVEFIGWVDSKINNKMYQKARIYVSIPSSDATSISLLEAIGNDCICFVSNLPANCEHILEGVNGFIESNLDKMDFYKHININAHLLEEVNGIRKKSYLKIYNKKIFLSIYDELIKGHSK